MFNIKAREGIEGILSKLDDNDLFALAGTVTQGLLRNKLTTRSGAIEAIVKYSPDVQSILRRKVITRELLFSYAHDNKLPAALPAYKNDLISVIYEYWNFKPIPNAVTQCTSQVSLLGDSETPINRRECTNQEIAVQDPGPSLDVNTMAVKFTEWFYTMMNSSEPLDVAHFWSDANIKVHLISPEQTMSNEVVKNPQEIVKSLFEIKSKHVLYFNPNLVSDGVQGRIDPHGLVIVLACGTLHSNNSCVGVFEQVFMLARDPFSDNNWKIKNSELNLKSSSVQTPPRLCDSRLTSQLLSLPQN